MTRITLPTESGIYNQAAESSLLGAMILNNDVVSYLSHHLKPEHFALEVNAIIYKRILQIVDDEEGRANKITLSQFFQSNDEIKEAGGVKYLSFLLQEAATALDVRHYANTIVDLWKRRQLESNIEKIKKEIADPLNSFEEIKKELEEKMEELVDNDEAANARHVADIVNEKLEEVFNCDNKDLVNTGFKSIDKYLGAVELSDLVIIGARPAMGKSILALNIAENIAETKNVLFISIEMSAKQLASRLLVKTALVDQGNLRYGKLNQAEVQSINQNKGYIESSNLFIDDVPKGVTIRQLRNKVRRMVNKYDTKVVIIDYLQLIKPENKKSASRAEEVGGIAEGLKAIAKEFNVCIFALAQLSRAVEQRENKRPQMSDLRESGSIESAANSIMFIYRGEYYLNREKPLENKQAEYSRWLAKKQEIGGKAEIIIAKNRDGVSDCTIELTFDGKYSQFIEEKY
jgi:replicative DNA helicase